MKTNSFDPNAIKAHCNGMLPAEVYQHMYDTALSAPEGNMVEVGCAHGAGTLCLAAGLRDSGRSGMVFTFEKILGGTREAFGGVEENIRIIESNFEHFGLADRIQLIVGDVEERANDVPQDTDIALLCLDADGAIDRDFAFFYDQVSPGAPIVIDDVLDRTRVKTDGRQSLHLKLKVDQKHRLTARLLGLFQEHGLVDNGSIKAGETWFGQKASAKFNAVPTADILRVYRSMTFTDAALPMMPMRSGVAGLLRRTLPASMFERLRAAERGD